MPAALLQRLGPGLLLCFFAAYGYHAGDIRLDFWSEEEPFNARSLPYAIAAAGSLVSALLLGFPGTVAEPPLPNGFQWVPTLRAIALLCLTAGFGFAIDLLGFVVTAILFLGTGFAVMGQRQPLVAIVTACLVVAGLWGLLSAMGIYLSPGSIWGIEQ